MGRLLMLLFFLFVCFTVEFFATIFTNSSLDSWYPLLNKPSWTPPPWLFGPVWTSLYALMGISVWLVWDKTRGKQILPYILFWIQLFFNYIWSYLFFTLQNPLYGLIDMFLLWFAILATLLSFRTISTAAAWLLVPYLLWVSYALSLNFSIWMHN